MKILPGGWLVKMRGEEAEGAGAAAIKALSRDTGTNPLEDFV